MAFRYSAKERYLTDEEYMKLAKDECSRTIAVFIIRILALMPFSLFLRELFYSSTESQKFIYILVLAILGLMLPLVFTAIFLFVIRIFFKLIICCLGVVCYLIDKIMKTNLMTLIKKILQEKAEEYEVEIMIFLSFIAIALFLHWLTLNKLTNPDYKNICISMVSMIYGVGIAKYSSPVFEIAGFDLELLRKKNKDKN